MSSPPARDGTEANWARLQLTLDRPRRERLRRLAASRHTHDLVLVNSLLAAAIDELEEEGAAPESVAAPADRRAPEDLAAGIARARADRGSFDTEPTVYGCSRQGRPLEVWLPSGESPRLLLVAGLHGEEPETTVLLSSALRALRPAALAAAVIVAANPDGIARGTRGNAAGVDLNRNFPAADWSAQPVVHHWTRADPRDVRLSPGARPASEPETTALIDLVAQLAPDAVVALHSPLARVIDNDRSPLGLRLARELRLPLSPSYPTPIAGSLDVWLRARGLGSVTVELPVLAKDALLGEYLGPIATLLAAPAGVVQRPLAGSRVG